MSRLPTAGAALLLVLALAACTGDEPGASPTVDPSVSPETAAQQLTERLLQSQEAPEPLATVTGTFLSSTGDSSPVEVDVLEVRAGEQSTLLRWRLRSGSDESVDVRSSALSRPSRFDTRAVALVDVTGNQRLQPFTYVPQRSDDDLMCVCSGLPIKVGREGIQMYALYPPLAPATTTVDVLVPGLTPAEDVEVLR